ncbi:MAG: hypothetical protein V4539_21980 [Bacteroidota bacterium]
MILYLLFFAVQVFFNFDVAQKKPLAQNTAFAKSSAGHSKNLQHYKSKPHSTSKIRLNKRFQPTTIPGIFHDLADVPVLYAQLKPVPLSQGNLYSLVFLSTHSLRGPPVIA